MQNVTENSTTQKLDAPIIPIENRCKACYNTLVPLCT